MPYNGYEQEAISNTAKDISDLSPVATATHVELQAETNHIRYTMDGSTTPTTTSGMLLLTTDPPKVFLMEDFRNIKFIRDAASDAVLNVHYFN